LFAKTVRGLGVRLAPCGPLVGKEVREGEKKKSRKGGGGTKVREEGKDPTKMWGHGSKKV